MSYTRPTDQRYYAEPALRQLLGSPTSPEAAAGDVRYRTYERGQLYWSAQTGVREVHGAILVKHLRLGGPGRWGAPAPTRQRHRTRGPVQPFAGGAIRWGRVPLLDAANRGARRLRRDPGAAVSLGWEQSYLGYPTSGEFDVAGGRRNNLQRGFIE